MIEYIYMLLSVRLIFFFYYIGVLRANGGGLWGKNFTINTTILIVRLMVVLFLSTSGKAKAKIIEQKKIKSC